MKAKFAVLLSVLVAFAACAPSASPGGDVGLARSNVARSSADPREALDAGAALDAFGLDLYRAVAAGQTNVVFSPASITLALAMARAGARGQTAAEMDAVMHAVASDEHAGWLNALDQALSARSGTFKDESGKDLAVTLRIANAPFAQQGMPLENAYLEALAARYGGGLRLVDYAAQTEKARALINGWVDAQTEHRIPELLVPGVLTPRNPPCPRQRHLPQGPLADPVLRGRDEARHVHARRRLDGAGAAHGHDDVAPATRPGTAGVPSRSPTSAARSR